MQCKDLEFALACERLGALPEEAREHLAGCSHCQEFLADLYSIVETAKTIPAEVAPPARVWVSLRAQLEAEGLIKEQVELPEASWWENLSLWLRPRSLVTAGAALVLLIAAVFLARTSHDSPGVVGKNPPAPVISTPSQTSAPQSAQGPTLPSTPAQVAAENSTPKTARPRVKGLAPSPSELASTTLAQAELDVPNMQLAGNSKVDASLRQNLRTLNEFIAECEQHLKKYPQDELAREYLNIAYQQKADLLAAMMESGRSEH